jgi:small subunit ribosomal protein S21
VQVLVRDNNVDQALRALKKKMQREGIFREMKMRGHYEKPSEKRAREKAEAVRRARKLARKRAQREGLLPALRPSAPGAGAARRRSWRWRRRSPPGALRRHISSLLRTKAKVGRCNRRHLFHYGDWPAFFGDQRPAGAKGICFRCMAGAPSDNASSPLALSALALAAMFGARGLLPDRPVRLAS